MYATEDDHLVDVKTFVVYSTQGVFNIGLPADIYVARGRGGGRGVLAYETDGDARRKYELNF